MKIATWNVERLKHFNRLGDIINACSKVDADIFVLTETDDRIRLNYTNCFQTQGLGESLYKSSERRVAVFTNYPCVRIHRTYDPETAICVELETEKGNLMVYGTIMGIYGNRCRSFQADLDRQGEDFKRLAEYGKALCVCGDFNCSFGDNYYFTKTGREKMNYFFNECKLTLLTRNQPECIDHIVISRSFVFDDDVSVKDWNCDKSLSDHRGIAVSLCKNGTNCR